MLYTFCLPKEVEFEILLRMLLLEFIDWASSLLSSCRAELVFTGQDVLIQEVVCGVLAS